MVKGTDMIKGGETGTDADMPPWLQPVPEEVTPPRGPLFYVLIGGAVAIVVLFLTAIAFVYWDQSDEGPVYVAAPDEAVRVKPENTGGLEVPHQDKAIYERGAGQVMSDDAELAPVAEEPVDVASAIEEQEGKVDEALGRPTAEDRREVSTLGTEKANVEVSDISKKTAPITETEPVKAKEEPAVEADPVNFRVQLGAYRSEDRANAAWRDLRRKFPDELRALSPVIQAAETSSGVFYRLRSGGFEKRPQADQLCLKLKAKDQACIVVKP